MKKKPNNMFKHKLYLLFILIIIIYCVNGYSLERYYQFYPTINVYPNNFNEVKIVEKYVKQKNQIMNDFIKLTDKSVSYAFQDIVIESREQLSKMEREIVPFITFFKNLFNRARPKQINENLNVFESVSADIDKLYGEYTQAGYEGQMIQGKAAAPADAFRSQAEVVRAMSDPKYDRDPAYRNEIMEKLARSDIKF